MPESLVDITVRNYRNMLDGREAGLVADMTRSWFTVETGIRAEMGELAYIIAQKRMNGEEITDQMLWKMERYQRLLVQVQEEMDKLNRSYADMIAGAQSDAFAIGVNASNDILTLSYQQAGVFNPFWERTDINAVENISALLQPGAPLYDLLSKDYPVAVLGLKDALIEGVARGFTPNQIALNMAQGFGMGLDRALLIAQTEVSRAYRTGQVQQYRQSGVVQRFYRFANKNTACFACLMLDGQVLRLNEELGDHPRGCCNTIAKVEGIPRPDWESGKDYFKNLPEDQQIRLMGKTRFDLWKSGQVKSLDWFVTEKFHKVWGSSPALLNLKDLQGIYGVSIKPKAPPIGGGKKQAPAPQQPAGGHFFDRIRRQPGGSVDTNKVVDMAFAELDKVFRPTKQLREILFAVDNSIGRGVLGQFAATRNNPLNQRIPLSIRIKDNPYDDAVNTIWHELGHFFDCEIGEATRDFISFEGVRGRGIAAALMNAFEGSGAIKTLRDAAAHNGVIFPPGGVIGSGGSDPNFIDYLLRPQEMFARGFAQWVTKKTGNPAALRDLRAYLGKNEFDAERYSQWEDADFADIERAFDDLFGGLGWIP